jgi:glycosyltransferase involved in cell wall biosynthesis
MLRASLGLHDDDIILMSLSRLERWKRIDRILRALPNIVAEEPRVKLLVVGDGTPDEKENLVNLTRQLGIESFVRFVGRVSHDNVADYLNLADIFISMYDLSNVGNPLLEAMSCGKCVITLNNGDTGQLISTEENGILLEMDQLEKLPESILRLVRSPELRQRLGQNALQFAQVNFWTWHQRMRTEVNEVSKLLTVKKVQS